MAIFVAKETLLEKNEHMFEKVDYSKQKKSYI
jgi:hypothetical protein